MLRSKTMSRLATLVGMAGAVTMSLMPAMLHAAAAPVELKWLDGAAPSTPVGVSWGVSWPQGQVPKNQAFKLTGADGKEFALQSWITGYWPDGSVKWTGFSTVAGPEAASLTIAPAAAPSAVAKALKTELVGNTITIDTGKIKATIPTQGENLITSIFAGDTQIAGAGQLRVILQNGAETDYVKLAPREEYVSNVKKVTLEQQGPVRAVVRFEGTHKQVSGSRELLPFVVRLYFFADQEQIKMVHTIVYDGDPKKDFVRGMGMEFDVPLRAAVGQRTVRVANSNGGLWSETTVSAGGGGGGGGGRGGAGRFGGAATQPAANGDQPATAPAPAADAARGTRGGPQARGGGAARGGRVGTRSNVGAEEGPAQWDSYKLTQLSSEGFRLAKRTNDQSSWVSIGEGRRASGYIFLGDASGGLGVSVKNFWQSYPASLEVNNAIKSNGKIHVWLWSPEGPAMDMRFYDTHGHGLVTNVVYEDYEEGFADPVGVGRTSELSLFPTAALPAREVSAAQAAMISKTPLLVETPTYMHSTGVFGQWSVQDRSTPFKKAVEDRLDSGVDYYISQIDQHHWYGFWNFGDVMHSAGQPNHQWNYDLGGKAWDNSELGSVIWAWMSYIRTGKAEYFRFAENLVRHTTEVDTYHIGRFAGMGSRHNVVHWGDSAKEARISQAEHGRFYYFLTTDERMGENLDLAAHNDAIGSALDPMRKAMIPSEEEKKFPGRIRMGPDWLAFAGNWMVAWERTGDTKWRDKIMAGVNSMAEMTFWTRSGWNLVLGYDPATGKLYQVKNQPFSTVRNMTQEQFDTLKTNPQPGNYNLPTIQGGAETAIEMTGLLNDPTWAKMWSQYCRIGLGDAETLKRDRDTGAEGADGSLVGEVGNSIGVRRLAAYAYHVTKNPAFAQRAIAGMGGPPVTPQRFEGAEALNPLDMAQGVSTNDMAQASLNDIAVLAMCADQLPKEVPANEGGRRGGGRGGARGGRGGGAARGAAGAAPADDAAPAGAQ